MVNMAYLRDLLNSKTISNGGSDEKTELLNDLFKQDDLFFHLDAETAYGILEYLGFNENNIEKAYMDLISPENFLETSKPYVSAIQK